MVIVLIIIHKNGKIAVGIEVLRVIWAKIHITIPENGGHFEIQDDSC